MRNYLPIFLLLLFSFNYTISQNKIALIIGNGDYQDTPLRNSVNDASDIASTLRSVGFTVTLKTNLDQQQMEDAIRVFGRSINAGSVSLFYFSGHGTQVKSKVFDQAAGDLLICQLQPEQSYHMLLHRDQLL